VKDREPRLSTSGLVIGTGGSGLRAAIELAERGMDVLAVGKRPGLAPIRPSPQAASMPRSRPSILRTPGILRNGIGERFMSRYDPQRMELSTRDRVDVAVKIADPIRQVFRLARVEVIHRDRDPVSTKTGDQFIASFRQTRQTTVTESAASRRGSSTKSRTYL
jgi:thioredoxin reductase